MMIHTTDGQTIGETSSTVFTVLQQGPVAMGIFLKNSGVNTANYRFQEYNGTSWVDLGASGSPLYNTLSPGQVVNLLVTSNFPQVQLLANASGGAFIDFSVTRYWNRAAGGALPILAL